MTLMKLVALGAAALLACAPVAAQNIATLPNAATLTGTEKMTAAQGAGCPTKVQPCTIVAVNPAQIATYLAPAFQPRDADLDAIAALATVDFGRQLLTKADAASVRSALGLGSIATQAASGVAITGGTIGGITDLAVADGGTGASTASAARGNLGAAAMGANADITSLSGLTTALSVAQGGTGGTTQAAARGGIGLPTALATDNNLLLSAGPYVSVVKADGVMEIGKYLDWHESSNTSATDYEYRISLSGTNLVFGGGLLFAASNTYDLGSTSSRIRATYSAQFRPGSGAPIWTSGSGAPSGTVSAPVGSLYTRTDGAAGATLYVKETGTDASGWVAK